MIDMIQEEIGNWLSKKNDMSRSSFQLPGIEMALGSSIGLIRKENQDVVSIFTKKGKDSFLGAVLCDGMGGMVDGRNCAELTLSAFLSILISEKLAVTEKTISQAVKYADQKVFKKYQGAGGSTFSAVFAIRGNINCFNVGDSRIYALDDKKKLHQLTTDDTLEGQLSAMQKVPNVNLFQENKQLVQYIGMGSDITVNNFSIPKVQNYHSILITSDGAHDLEKKILENLIANTTSSKAIVERLIFLSEWLGGKDNASVISLNFQNLLFYTEPINEHDSFEINDHLGRTFSFPLEVNLLPKPNLTEDDKKNLKIVQTSSSGKSDKQKYYRKKKEKKTPQLENEIQPKEKVKINIKIDEDE